MQQYSPIGNVPVNTTRSVINNNLATIMSQSGGTAFPTTDLYKGRPCYREDQQKLYVCTDEATPVWEVMFDFALNKSPNADMLDGYGSGEFLRKAEDYFAGHHAEGRTLVSAATVNDFANARLRGSVFTPTNVSPSNANIDSMFDGKSSFYSFADTVTWPVVLEFTVPRTLTYGASVGIGFGNAGWRCQSVKIEAFSEGAWVTCVDTTSNVSEDVYVPIPGNSGVGTTKMRYTLDNPASSSIRICHLWGHNYNSAMWSEIQMPRAGGLMYGALDVTGGIYEDGTALSAKYLGIGAKASDSELLDGIDSSGFSRYSTGGTISNALGDRTWVASYADASNVDHIHHDDAANEWHFVSGSTFRADGNATVRAGAFREGATLLSAKYLGINAKADNAELFDAKDSSQFIYGDNLRGSTAWTSGADNITKSGFYYINTDFTNIPGGHSNGYLLHEGYPSSTDYAKQTYMSYTNNTTYTRRKQGGAWGSWVKIYHDGNFTKTEIDALNINADTVDGFHASGLLQTGAHAMQNIAYANATEGTSYAQTGLQIREGGLVGAGSDNWQTAPRLGFHWNGRVASQIGMNSSGTICVLNNPGNAYENFKAKNVDATGTLTATGLATFNGGLEVTSVVGSSTKVKISGTSPSLFFEDTDSNNNAWVNYDNNIMYFLADTNDDELYDGAPYPLYLNMSSGDAVFKGSVTANSDIRLKENIQVIPGALGKVNQLGGYTWDRKDSGERQTGTVAQELLKVLPEAVIKSEDTGYYSVAYGQMAGLFIEAIKELTTRLETLEAA